MAAPRRLFKSSCIVADDGLSEQWPGIPHAAGIGLGMHPCIVAKIIFSKCPPVLKRSHGPSVSRATAFRTHGHASAFEASAQESWANASFMDQLTAVQGAPSHVSNGIIGLSVSVGAAADLRGA